VDQWSYHTRLYNAAEFVSRSKNLELIQLNSFGCGLDAVTTDQVKEILESKSKIYTVIKIDEISNLGAVKIRLRSLIAALNGRDDSVFPERESYTCHPVKFEKTMKDYTIIAPELSPIHFQFLERVFNNNGYNLVIPEMDYDNDVDEGLKYVNHDACYPSLITVGQIMNALNSGKYDLNKTAVIISQTGGGCRATNYIGFLRKALKDSSLDHIPVISLNPSGIEKNSGFKISYKLLKQGLRSLVYGDLLMRVVLKTRPYEMYEGQIEELYNRMRNLCFESLDKGFKDYKEVINHIVYEFDKVELLDIKKPKVGVVGEILVKFHPLANGNVVDNIEKEGGEAVVPDFYDFLLYCSYTGITREKLLSGKKMKSTMSKISISYLESLRKPMVEALEKSNRFHGPKPINYLAQKAEKLLSLGNFTGEGWFLTGEIVELVEEGVNNVLCLQPFGCLPNHITGKGMIRSLRERYPLSNIHPVDYDPGASEVNQLNRIKLMMSVAMDNL
jgi:predicted nucleotide-binding protein (sugar kinase/HSP70/actin superfamily)